MSSIRFKNQFLVLSAFLLLSAITFFSCEKNPDDTPNTHPLTAATEYINYTVNGIPYSYALPTDSIISVSRGPFTNVRIIANRLPVTQDSLILAFDNIAIQAGAYQHMLGFKASQIPVNANVTAPAFVYISECGPTGQYISGNFSVTYADAPPVNTIYAITCNFRIKRIF